MAKTHTMAPVTTHSYERGHLWTAHSYEREGICPSCASVHGCQRWRDRDPAYVFIVGCTGSDDASRFRPYRDDLIARGIASSARWIDIDWPGPTDVLDYAALRKTDVVIAFESHTFDRGSQEETMAMAIGYALALGKRVIFVEGKAHVDCPYHATPQIEHVRTWYDALALLGAPTGR